MDPDDILIKKCVVTADTRDNNDSILISGLMNADFNDVIRPEAIEVDIVSDDLNIPCIQTLVIARLSKKAGFRCSKTTGSLKTSFALDTRNYRFSFYHQKTAAFPA